MAWTSGFPTVGTTLKDVPGKFTDNCAAIEAFTGSQHESITTATVSGKHVGGKSSIMMVNTTAVINAIVSPPPCAVAWDTTLRVLKYYSGLAWINLGGAIPTGTKMLFYQDTAPVGWTTITTSAVDDTCAFITNGSAAGGETGGGEHSTGTWDIEFVHTHTSSAHVVTIAELPYHRHTWYPAGSWRAIYSGEAQEGAGPQSEDGSECTVIPPYAGSDVAHTSEYTTTIPSVGGPAWRPASYCCILCQKD